MKKCEICPTNFKPRQEQLRLGRGKYCSYKCYWVSRKGKRVSIETEFKKNQLPWNKGIPISQEVRRNLVEKLKGKHSSPKTEFKKGQNLGERNPNWIGDNVGYFGLHDWVRFRLGKAKVCEFCGKSEGRIEWANKSHEYKRDISDWLELCKKCHIYYDLNYGWGDATRRWNL